MSEQTPDAQLKKLDVAEHAIDSALNSGIVDRHTITKKAHQEATDSLEMVGAAIESDEVADEARRITMIAEQGGDRERIKRQRKVQQASRIYETLKQRVSVTARPPRAPSGPTRPSSSASRTSWDSCVSCR